MAKGYGPKFAQQIRDIATAKLNGKVIALQEVLPWYNLHSAELTLQLVVKNTGTLVGYANFHTHHSLNEVVPDCLKIGQVYVAKPYRSYSNAIFGFMMKLADQSGVPLYLNVEPTHDMPQTPKQLEQWYSHFGFRKLKPNEVKAWAMQNHLHDISKTLLFAGYEHATGKLTGKRRDSLTPQEIAKMDSVDPERRIALYREMLRGEYGHDSAHQSNLRSAQATMSELMLREPAGNMPENAEALFKMEPGYRLYTRRELLETREKINKSGRKAPIIRTSMGSSHRI